MDKPCVMLIAFYNKKALGVRYLETALRKADFSVRTVFYKDFNSVHPKSTTAAELELLRKDIEKHQPVYIGLSVMSSMYQETIDAVLDMLKSSFDIPIVCGGAYASLFPREFLARGASFVIRSDGEYACCRLARALESGESYESIPSLCYMKNGEAVINDVGGLTNDIDSYGIPTINCPCACYIDDDAISEGDPQLDTLSYEVIASRGCPFTCSYCSCVNLRRLLPPGVKPVRTRSVQSVIDELIEAKKQCPKIVFVHFYDEIFPNSPGWVDEFTEKYKKHINLPFTIWSHPKMVDREMIKKLVKVGLTEVIMGIQSGSDHIRRDVFHRYETREDILSAVKAIRDSGVFWSTYDFIVQHPFESVQDLKDSYYLVKDMPGPLELQIHSLNFLPGTDIVDMAIKEGCCTEEEMHNIMYGSVDQQFSAFWELGGKGENELWCKMTYCLQFAALRKKISSFESDPLAHREEIDKLYALAQKLFKLRYYYKKGRIVLSRMKLLVFK